MKRNVVAVVLGVVFLLSSNVSGQEELELPHGTTDEELGEALKGLSNLKDFTLDRTRVTDVKTCGNLLGS